MATRKELKRKDWVLDQIISDSAESKESRLADLDEMPEYFIDYIYDVSYDEMTKQERSESIAYIKEQLENRM